MFSFCSVIKEEGEDEEDEIGEEEEVEEDSVDDEGVERGREDNVSAKEPIAYSRLGDQDPAGVMAVPPAGKQQQTGGDRGNGPDGEDADGSSGSSSDLSFGGTSSGIYYYFLSTWEKKCKRPKRESTKKRMRN